ncbi:family 20 glycosylhydrolase [Roseivirga sp.]|uniref:family 20 glycosylhydrolase n=1 Tax=Roseivirga sp. TaxID=1964215 RepID=UPI003B8C2D51
MRNSLLLFVLVFTIFSCDKTTSLHNIQEEYAFNLVPVPKSFTPVDQLVRLSNASEVYASDEALKPLMELFVKELASISGHSLQVAESASNSADIVFMLDDSFGPEAYIIEISNTVKVSGGSYAALAMARSTLLQTAVDDEGQLAFPVTTIDDRPDSQYRGLMIDLARNWHTVENLKSLIDMASFYKSNYVHLHFTDYQSYTLPSRKYPNLSTKDRHYSFEDLEELERYSQERGIIIIPEIDIPGHASSIVQAYPALFRLKDIKENPWTINMGKEEVYTALDEIIGELIPIFKSTPYFHIGGDEAIFHKVDNDPHVQSYMKANNLGEDVHELYRHFLVRMNDMVKKYGKQMAVWEGFRTDGEVEIPKDIIVYEFETNRYLPNDLVRDGYTVVNTSWKPLYVVNRKKFAPETIYNWNVWRWENWFPRAPSFVPIQLERTNQIIGAQMCAWEQPQTSEFRSLRKRLPVMMERVWSNDQRQIFEIFMDKLEATDQVLSKLSGITAQDDKLHGYDYVDDRPNK